MPVGLKGFQKGHSIWLGKNHSEETKIKQRESAKNRPPVSEETKEKIRLVSPFQKGYTPWNKNIPCSDETKTKMSEAKKGKVGNNKGKHWKVKDTSNMGHTAWNKNIPCREETRKKISQNNARCWLGKTRPDMKGRKPWNWIEDRTKLCRTSKQGERRTSAYFDWRKQIYTRDNWKCKINDNDCNGRIEAHHILGWTLYPELRYVVNNGITLCHYHHPKKREEEIKLITTFQNLLIKSY